ncbi:hypothetical protein POM88_043550 [Heracleum sosnowskyi]|uniref:Uncharacterized protein n=1 Tax=Heracleum sosnowskyi TaxID=360622 RepID=A0AAD8H280_9APIA|nr:hypothetical protein POM88_043550 [Heracleum sosnowskyi]
MFVLFSYEVEEDDQYTSVVDKEDYENAIGLQVAITAATQNDVVGKVMSKLNKAIEEGRFEDETFLRDNTGVGLFPVHAVSQVGWWAGVSQHHKDPYGHIIHIYPEHGRFVAKSYSPCFLSRSHVHNASKAFPVNGYEFSVDNSEILKKFEQFKKFEIVEDFTDHHFVNDGTSTKKQSQNSLKRIQEEWKILEKDLLG